MTNKSMRQFRPAKTFLALKVTEPLFPLFELDQLRASPTVSDNKSSFAVVMDNSRSSFVISLSSISNESNTDELNPPMSLNGALIIPVITPETAPSVASFPIRRALDTTSDAFPNRPGIASRVFFTSFKIAGITFRIFFASSNIGGTSLRLCFTSSTTEGISSRVCFTSSSNGGICLRISETSLTIRGIKLRISLISETTGLIFSLV